MQASGAMSRFAAAIAWNASALAQGSAAAWDAAQSWSTIGQAAEVSEPLGRLGALEVRLAAGRKDVRRAQRVRYKVFFEQGQAIPDALSAIQRRDLCPFDTVCDHLIVVDHDRPQRRMGKLGPKVVGTYRLLRQAEASRHFGFYSGQEFDLGPLLGRHAGKQFLELGRSCVLPAYRSKRTIELLWRGIGAYAQRHAIDVLFGCASLEGTDADALALSLSFLHHHAGAEPDWQASPLPGRRGNLRLLPAACIDRRVALAGLPPLVKGYLRAGARFSAGFVIDHQFGTTDVLAVMPLAEVDARYLSRFGSERAFSSEPVSATA